jgi:pimeloyl-ACP methyl ester carboxylesterase
VHIVVLLSLLLPIVLLLGFAYQHTGGRRDRRRLLERGGLVSLGDGTRLYLSRLGQGSPAVLFESGIGGTSQNWLALQREVSQYTTAVAYDRAGLGWSGRARTPRTPANVARELHEMLEVIGLKPPYILVGHSFGGLVMRRFALEHAEEVAALVLLDPMRPEEWPPANAEREATLDRGIRLTGVAEHLARFGLARLAANSLLLRRGRASRAFSRAAGDGGKHVLDRVTCEMNKLPRETWPAVAAHWSSPRFFRGFRAHLRGVRATVLEMQDAGSVIVPVVHFTASTSTPLDADALSRIGASTRQTVTSGGHWVHLDEPDLVASTIAELVEQARKPLLGSTDALAS